MSNTISIWFWGVTNWCPVLYKSSTDNVQALLAAPEPDDPQDAVVARQYQENFSIFKETAQHWAASFAGSSYKVALTLLFLV